MYTYCNTYFILKFTLSPYFKIKDMDKFKGKDRSATGSTNTEKLRSKNYLMVQKARKVKAKVVRSWKQVNSAANKRAKKLKHGVLKNEARKRRRQ